MTLFGQREKLEATRSEYEASRAELVEKLCVQIERSTRLVSLRCDQYLPRAETHEARAQLDSVLKEIMQFSRRRVGPRVCQQALKSSLPTHATLSTLFLLLFHRLESLETERSPDVYLYF